MPVILCQKLVNRYPHQKWVAFLDNLFLNEPVAYALLYLGVGVIGTTRKNATGVPSQLIALKERNTAMTYGSTLFHIVNSALCFA